MTVTDTCGCSFSLPFFYLLARLIHRTQEEQFEKMHGWSSSTSCPDVFNTQVRFKRRIKVRPNSQQWLLRLWLHLKLQLSMSCCSKEWTRVYTCLDAEASLLKKSSSLAAALGVSKFTSTIAMNFTHNKHAYRQRSQSQFVKQKLKLSSSFRCDQICINHCWELIHTLLRSLSLT